MAKSAWTTKKPTKPGWWWVRYLDEKNNEKIVQIQWGGNKFYVTFPGIDHVLFVNEMNNMSEWQPVQPPKP